MTPNQDLPDPSNFNFCIYTDGSGHEDEVGGWAFRITTTDNRKVLREGVGSSTATDTFDMEFTAILRALHSFFRDVDSNHINAGLGKAYVIWYTDCEGLTKLIAKLKDKNSYPGHRAWLGKLMEAIHLTPVFIPRETPMEHLQWCDFMASSMRVLLKSFLHQTKK